VVIALVVGGLIVGLGAIDFFSGGELSFAVFYLIPVGLAAWYIDRFAGVVTSFVCAGVWVWADLMAGTEYQLFLAPFWNALARLATFIAFAYVLALWHEERQRAGALSRTDPATGVANTRAFYESALAEIDRTRRYGHPITLAVFEIEDLPTVSKALGEHDTGELLQLLSRVVGRNIRTNDQFARVREDRFVVLLPETNRVEAGAVLMKVTGLLSKAVRDRGWKVNVNLAAATFPEAPTSVDEMLRAVDGLMQRSSAREDGVLEHEVVGA
jgi:diguanylate cyclase (GGDEF)-like protein